MCSYGNIPEGPVTFNEILIALVRERPALWDSQNPLYRDKIVKNKLWDEIGVLMQKYGENDVKGKWKHLRDRYTKCIKDDNGRNLHFMGKKTPWNLLPQLEFLRDAVSHRSSPENSHTPHYYHPGMAALEPVIMAVTHSETGTVRRYDDDDSHNNDCNELEDTRSLDMKDGVFVNVTSPGSSDATREVNDKVHNYQNPYSASGGQRSSRTNKRDRADEVDIAILKYLKERKTESEHTAEDLFFQSVAKESQQLNAFRRAKLKLKVQEFLVQLLEEQSRTKPSV